MSAPVGTPVGLLRADLPPWQRWLRYKVVWLITWLLFRTILRIRLEGREHLVKGPAMYCFNHMSWADPLILLAALPASVRLYFYGPKEETLRRGARNRLMWWSGIAVPFKPGKDDLLTSIKRAQAVFNSAGGLAIAGEGAIHVHEGDLLPLHEGAAYLALRAAVPIVPVAIGGTSWLGFRRLVRVRVSMPIHTGDRPTHDAIEAYTWRTWHALRAMVDDDPELPVPGRFGRWFTEMFNDWGPGGRAGKSTVRGPDPAATPIGPDGVARSPVAGVAG